MLYEVITPVTKGATTIWERWDCIKPDGSFQDVGMNSFNHYAYGAVGNWLYQTVAGLQEDPAVPGYKKIVVKPTPTEQLQFAKANYHSIYGEIRSGWERKANSFIQKVEVPANTSAKIYFVITSYSIHYTKLYEDLATGSRCSW